MIFILGVITGLLIAILVIVVLTFFREPIESKINIVKKQMDAVTTFKPKGYIIEPPSRADEVREKIIADNTARGRDTTVEELR